MNKTARFIRNILMVLIGIGLLIFASFRSHMTKKSHRTPEPLPSVRWGFINKVGALVIPTKFDDIGKSTKQGWGKVFSEGLCAAKLDGKWGYIDHSGQWQIKPRFYVAHAFSEGLAYVFDGTTYGYINPQGALVIKPMGDPLGIEPGILGESLVDFSDGRAVIRVKGVKGLYGYIDHSGNTVIEPQYLYAGQFSEGLAEVLSSSSGCWGYLYRCKW